MLVCFIETTSRFSPEEGDINREWSDCILSWDKSVSQLPIELPDWPTICWLIVMGIGFPSLLIRPKAHLDFWSRDQHCSTETNTLWSRTTNSIVSIGPLARPFACSLALLIRLLRLACFAHALRYANALHCAHALRCAYALIRYAHLLAHSLTLSLQSL